VSKKIFILLKLVGIYNEGETTQMGSIVTKNTEDFIEKYK
jgi:hypothetical protein